MAKTLEQIKADAALEVFTFMVQEFGMAQGLPTRQMAEGVAAMFHREIEAVYTAANPGGLADAIRKALDGTLGVDDGCVSIATGAVLGALKPFLHPALPEGVRNGDQVRQAMRLRKLKCTKTAYEAAVTGDTPEQAVALAVLIDSRYLAHKEQGKDMASKAEPSRGDLPPWITPEGNLMAAGGLTGPRNYLVEAMQEDYRVKIDITRNTKGVGWDITVKPTSLNLPSIDEAMAMRADVEQRLRDAFPFDA